jgi:polysaccharide biosynthesis/export protein
MQVQPCPLRVLVVVVCTALSTAASAQTGAQVKSSVKEPAGGASVDRQLPEAVTPPLGYVIGADDVLSIRFWSDEQLSAEAVVVRPDGKVSVPLLNDVQATGLTPEQLSEALEKAATKFIEDPNATVIVREIRSRKVYVLGQVAKPGSVPLNGEMNVLQLLASVGGVSEYADKGGITVIRTENGKEQRFKFNYNDVVKGKNMQQNIRLQPGDTVVVN